jgi:glycerol-3-phosphate dehydrogenase (NAD(P)+)
VANIAIVGAGYMGTATAYPLSDNGHAVRLVGTHLDRDIIKSCLEQRYHPKLKRKLPEGVQPYYVDDVAQALDGVDVVVSGVNSMGVHWISQTIGPYLQPGQLVIAVTKGLEAAENGDLLILPDVLASDLPEDIRDRVGLAAIGGPCIAGELAGRRHSCVVFGSRDGDVAGRLAAIFRTGYYHVWTTTDLLGLELCAALKNGYTLGVGMAAGLLERAGGVDAAGASMHNLAAALFAQACTEIDRMLQVMGGTRAFARGLPAPGDLYVTVQGGRSMRLGKLLGLGRTYAEAKQILAEETLEAAFVVQVLGEALPKLVARGVVSAADFPLMQALIDVVVHERPLDLPFDAFFQDRR